MRVRKQVYDLTVDDLESHPVWCFASDEEGQVGQDEATVKPAPTEGPVDPGAGLCVVRARFELADGSPSAGYLYTRPTPLPSAICSEGDSQGIALLQPTVITPRGQVGFWLGLLPPSEGVLDNLYAVLSKRGDEVFPLRFCSDVPVEGGDLSGEVAGFMHIVEEKRGILSRRCRVVRTTS